MAGFLFVTSFLIMSNVKVQTDTSTIMIKTKKLGEKIDVGKTQLCKTVN